MREGEEKRGGGAREGGQTHTKAAHRLSSVDISSHLRNACIAFRRDQIGKFRRPALATPHRFLMYGESWVPIMVMIWVMML